jgi:uncharacterized SAM-binding protein YcdF (DUF218 family)
MSETALPEATSGVDTGPPLSKRPAALGRATAWRGRGWRLVGGFAAGVLFAYGALVSGLDAIPPFYWVRMPLLAGLAGALAGLSRAWWGVWLAAAAVWFGFLVVGHTPLLGPAVRALVRSDSLERVEAVVVLSSDIRTDGSPDRAMQQRLDHAYRLMQEGYACRLVVTRLRMRSQSYVPAVRRQAQAWGLQCPVEETEPITNTRDEVIRIGRLAHQRGWGKMILVSDPMHMRRVAALCRKSGTRVICSPASYQDYDYTRLSTPEDRRAAFRNWLEEVYYFETNRARGWL